MNISELGGTWKRLHEHGRLVFGVECTILYDRIGNEWSHMSTCDGFLGGIQGTRSISSVLRMALLLRYNTIAAVNGLSVPSARIYCIQSAPAG